MKKYYHLVDLTKVVSALEKAVPAAVNEMKAFPHTTDLARKEIEGIEYHLGFLRVEIGRIEHRASR